MAVPEGYTALGRLGYADKGNYAAGTTYMTGDVVYHNGSSYVARKDNLKGVTPVNGNDWKYLARGFAAETMTDVQATDTSGVLGTAGAQVVSQSLIDAIADRVMTKLIGTNQIVNNLLATEPGSVLDATQGKALKEYYDRVSSDLAPQLIGSTTSADGTISSANFSKYRFLIVRIGAGGWSRTEFFINQSYIGAFYALDNTADQKIRLDYDGTKIKLSGYSGGSFNICEAYGFVLK